MKKYLGSLVIAFAVVFLANVQAQVAVVPSADHDQMLASPDARLAANKRLVYDFWREVFEAGHMELAAKYMAEGYIQHNPNVATGRVAFVDFFSKNVTPGAIQPRVKAPLVAILADGDLVVLAFAREAPDPKDPAKKYTTTWFDMFRIEGGKIAEHWDPATKRQ
jgi:predicted SnoaL-like aldol condensation-catalyzing enzyme